MSKKPEMSCNDIVNNNMYRVTESGKTLFAKCAGVKIQYRIDWNSIPQDIQYCIKYPTTYSKGKESFHRVEDYLSKFKGVRIN